MEFNRSEIEPLIGKESRPIKALDDVSTSNVRRWYEMMTAPDMVWVGKMKSIGENPFPYMEEARERLLSEQKHSRERSVPLPMMMIWARQAYWSPEPKEPSEPHELAMKALEDAGYALTIGVNLDDELVKPVNIGDWLSYQITLVGISADEEKTKLGKGYLVDLLYAFTNQQGELVSRHHYTILKAKKLNPVSAKAL